MCGEDEEGGPSSLTIRTFGVHVELLFDEDIVSMWPRSGADVEEVSLSSASMKTPS